MTEKDKNAVKDKIINAYKKLLEKDIYLLKNDVNERSITHKMAEYLQQEFSEYHVDCEYNRDGHFTKKLATKKIDTDDIEAQTIYPDIIIHKRGDNNNNFVIIEAKKAYANEIGKNKDIQKLKDYEEQLHYKFAIFITFYIGEDVNKYKIDGLKSINNSICFI